MNTDPQTLLGRYKLVKVLGRGAMGVVYEAIDTRLSRTVAIKTVLRSFLADDATSADYTARFEREAQAAARLNHPHIVAVFDFGEQDDVAFIVMEFVRGRELGQALAEGEKFSLEETVRIMGELLDALAYAHEHGIVHRDVKPANVMIDGAGRVKLTDFGVARLADTNQDRTLPGTMVGTPSYMAPEQILGLAVGSRADIFGAGVVLYQFLTGTRPFVGGGPFGVQRKIVHDDPLPPSQVNPAVPAGFDAIVSRALAKQPEDRYETAAAFAADLRRLLKASQPAATDTAPDAALDLDSTVVMASGQTLPLPPPPATTVTVPPPPQAAEPTQSLSRSQGGAPDVSPTATSALSPTASPAAPPAVPATTATITATTAMPPAPAKTLKLWIGAVAVAGAAVGGLWLLARPGPVTGPAALPVTPAVSAPAGPAPHILPAAPAPSLATRPADRAPAAAASQASAPDRRPPAAVSTPSAPLALPLETPARAGPATTPARNPGVRATPPDPRCNDLLLRMQLGDVLTPEQTTYFHTRCAR
jgi:serine/threonine-protein kinase